MMQVSALHKQHFSGEGHYQFLIIRRFDCVGWSTRRGVVSLKALDMKFAGSRDQRWPVIARQLVEQGIVEARIITYY